jgi:dienelactone hydrolase
MGRGMGSRAALAALICIFASAATAQIFEPVSFPLVYEGHQIQITGRFEKPPGAGPFPAAIILHGCEGYQSGLWHTTTMASALHALGIATLITDSYTPRGYTTCDNVRVFERALDVYGAASLLAHRADIRPDQIAVMGFSQGGGTTLFVAAAGAPNGPGPALLKDIEANKSSAYLAQWQAQLKAETADFAARNGKFAAYVAFYPSYCQVAQNEAFSAPLLILIGDFDNRVSGGACERLAAVPRPGAPEVRFKLYPGASHGFDMNMGYRSNDNSRYRIADRDAATDAPKAVRDFLREYLAPPATVPQISQGGGG